MTDTQELKTYADYQKYNFFRTPEWRWERVLSLVDRPGDIPGRCTRRDDKFVRAAKLFLPKRRFGDPLVLEKLKFENPGLFYAYDFHQAAQEDQDAAMYIQARVLARQTPEQIGKVLGILPEAVEWYCHLFFDVIPYLDQRDWITKQVIVPALVRTATKKPVDDDLPQNMFKDSSVARPFMDGTLKLFAYHGGTHLVDLLIAGLQVGKPLVGQDDTDNWLDRTTGTTIRRRTAQAAQMFEINKYNVMELFAVHTRLMEIARSEENQDQARSVIEKHIKATVEEIPWAVGSDGEKLYDGTMVGRFDLMAGELRDDELILVASGQTARTVAPDNFPTTLPPPRKDKKSVLMSNSDDI
jgi:hypothetical protein